MNGFVGLAFLWLCVPNDNDFGSPATGQAITDDGLMSYKKIKAYIQDNIGVHVTYIQCYICSEILRS
jgi:hypothetical protein